MRDKNFRNLIWDFYRTHGRHDLPWRKTKNPYEIFVSEVMLQQTQVSRVLQKYPEFLSAFPNFLTLAHAQLAEIFSVWRGMGYNRRAVYLKEAASVVVSRYNGTLPNDPELLRELPGIGRATAASITAFTFNRPVVFIETNIRRVFIHHFFLFRHQVTDAEIMPILQRTLDVRNPRKWYWALMDYGAALGTVVKNPNRRSAHYIKQLPFEGSRRQMRGRVLQMLVQKNSCSVEELSRELGKRKGEISRVLASLTKDGFLHESRKRYQILQSIV
ncbi:MAG: A/G-specific adenine glycosylase [Candidatus Sungbacteria bacterium]|nr:A/G-specific adenine glycosylase [Candidatus Sungbacteria bacterium]